MGNTSVALGTFDGVHIGHAAVLKSALMHENPVAVAFLTPPAMEITQKYEMLMTSEQKIKKLQSLGFRVEALEFSAVRDMTAKDFLLWLKDTFCPSYISCGFDYRFGKGAEGNSDLLKAFCKENGISLNCVPPVLSGENKVSSSLIRDFVKAGDIVSANALLSEPFSVTGTVLHGQKRGRTLGFPTVNIDYPDKIVAIKNGVYASFVTADGVRYGAMSYFGNRPTFKVDRMICESHIFNFEKDLYGKEITVSPVKFIRDEVAFKNSDELRDSIERDIISAKKVFG